MKKCPHAPPGETGKPDTITRPGPQRKKHRVSVAAACNSRRVERRKSFCAVVLTVFLEARRVRNPKCRCRLRAISELQSTVPEVCLKNPASSGGSNRALSAVHGARGPAYSQLLASRRPSTPTDVSGLPWTRLETGVDGLDARDSASKGFPCDGCPFYNPKRLERAANSVRLNPLITGDGRWVPQWTQRNTSEETCLKSCSHSGAGAGCAGVVCSTGAVLGSPRKRSASFARSVFSTGFSSGSLRAEVSAAWGCAPSCRATAAGFA